MTKIKLTRKQLKDIVLEELEEIRTDSRGFGPAQVATAKALSNKGIATRPESVRTRLMQLVADLDLKNPTQQEIRQIADMVSDLMDAAQDADAVGLEESHSKNDEEKIKDIISQLRRASKEQTTQADALQKVVNDSPDNELHQEEGSACGSEQEIDNNLTVYIKEELQKYLEERYSQKGK